MKVVELLSCTCGWTQNCSCMFMYLSWNPSSILFSFCVVFDVCVYDTVLKTCCHARYSIHNMRKKLQYNMFSTCKYASEVQHIPVWKAKDQLNWEQVRQKSLQKCGVDIKRLTLMSKEKHLAYTVNIF